MGEELGLLVVLVALVFGAAGLTWMVGDQRRRSQVGRTSDLHHICHQH